VLQEGGKRTRVFELHHPVEDHRAQDVAMGLADRLSASNVPSAPRVPSRGASPTLNGRCRWRRCASGGARRHRHPSAQICALHPRVLSGNERPAGRSSCRCGG
jgi:hypothetical protein